MGSSNVVMAAVLACCSFAAAHGQGAADAPVARPPLVQGNASTGTIAWLSSYADAIKLGKNQNKPVLVDFYADWCSPCRAMDVQTYGAPRVARALSSFVCVKVDVDSDQRTAFAYGVRSIPRTVILNVFGELIGDHVGFLDSDAFLRLLNDAGEYAYKEIDGLRIEVPTDASMPAAANPVLITKDTELSRLVELLAAKTPAERERAREELLLRDTPETKKVLLDALASEYLGARISAWVALTKLRSDIDFDPWAPKQARLDATKRIRSLLGVEASASD